jgi:hypothetical protein
MTGNLAQPFRAGGVFTRDIVAGELPACLDAGLGIQGVSTNQYLGLFG